ncbi:hypothetical protein MRB56_09180 [Halomonas cupida]|uniref:hypothetical protein n=1 Tax=Halomonas cupida TaxID=44933 RepID=UPI0039B67695
MNWKTRSPHSIQCGDLTISRTRHGGKELYTLWRGEKRLGIYGSAAKAKQAAEEQGQ